MKRHRIAYIDEREDEIRRFQRLVSKTLDVLPFVPEPDLSDFVEKLLNTDAEAFVVDFRLNEYRTAVSGPITYTGADLVEKILESRKGFPCFVLTSYDADAVQETDDVNYVYSKDVLKPDHQPGQVTFAERIRIQIEHYKATIESKTKRLHALIEKSEQQVLSEEEENELLKLDTFLESALHDHTALPLEKKNQLVVGRVEDLISATDELLRALKGGDD